jgi:parallel beta-helix repeat protein
MLPFLGRNFQRVVLDRVNDRLHSENPYGRLTPFFVNVAKMILANAGNANALIGIINQASGVQIDGALVDSTGGVYVPVANVAAIPATPGNGDRIEVMDSTGIESFTPLSGLPPGFVGSNQVKVRLIFNGTDWVWSGSSPVDPTAYYLLRSELSAAVNSASTTTPASVAGVKTAYDAAVTAQSTATSASGSASSAVSTANTASSNASTAVSTANSALSAANAALPKSGGTMTGGITFNAGQTLNNLTFTQSGAGAQARSLTGKLGELPSVLDFIPAAEHAAILNGSSTYDCTTAFQAAIAAHRRVYVPYGVYTISATLELNESYSGLIGDPRMPFIYKSNPASGPAVSIGATGANLNEFSALENLVLWHGTPATNPRPAYPTTPAAANCGLAIDGTGSSASPAVQRARVSNVRLIGWAVGAYLGPSVNTLLDRVIVENHTNWTANQAGLTSANRYVGFYFNCTPVSVGGISPQASVEVENCIVNGGFAPDNVTAFGFWATGSDVRDIFMTNCETSGGDYGFFVENTGADWNWDIHIIRPIADAWRKYGIVLKNLNGPAAATVSGGYSIRAAGVSGFATVLLDTCSGCFVGNGFHALGFTSGDANEDGIRLLNSQSCMVNGVSVVNCRYGISLEGGSLNTIVGNTIGAGTPALEPSPTLSVGVRVFTNSNGNVIVGNTIRGASVTARYPEGINIGSGCSGNQLSCNTIETATVITPVAIAAGNQQRIETPLKARGSQSFSADTSLFLVSEGGPQYYQGNDAASPHVFRDGSAVNISYIANSGAYVQLSDASRKNSVELIGAVLSRLASLQGKTFVVDNDGDRRRLGLIAQEVQPLFPEAVFQMSDGILGLDYAALVPVLINAINELRVRVETLETGS